jgi:uncharacterized protein (DUF362 family)
MELSPVVSKLFMSANSLFSNPTVAAHKMPNAKYPAVAPFHPGIAYPEYALKTTSGENLVYDGVRQLLHSLGLDGARFGTPEWNPFGELIRPGDKVVLKPNLIGHAHRYDRSQWEQVITHGSVVRAVTDYVLVALQGKGEIWIADGPQLDADLKEILARTGIGKVVEWYASQSPVPIKFLDLRDEWEDMRGDVLFGTKKLPGDPNGCTDINLASRSRFEGHQGAGRYYGATYDQKETNYHHSEGRHEYRISRTVASADVFINLPKIKTHKKVGVTLCLKNLVGINTGRNWLPHHTDGEPNNGGDQFPVASTRSRSERLGVRNRERLTIKHPKLFAPVYKMAKKVATPFWGHTRQTIRSGNWHGNDTCWRMVQDINRCLLYSDGQAFPTAQPKRFFAIVDGVVAGEADGPAAPDRLEAGVLIAGFNPVAVDCATARLMGFDPMKIPTLREAFAPADLPLAPFAYGDISIKSNRAGWEGKITELENENTLHFEPHFGWKGRIEWKSGAAAGQPEIGAHA